jgi:hypothetical protein
MQRHAMPIMFFTGATDHARQAILTQSRCATDAIRQMQTRSTMTKLDGLIGMVQITDISIWWLIC